MHLDKKKADSVALIDSQKNWQIILLKRCGSKVVDALIMGSLGATVVASFLLAGGDFTPFNKVLYLSAVAFAIAFLDVLSLSGFVVLILFMFFGLFLGPSFLDGYRGQLFFSLLPLNFVFHLLYESKQGATPGKKLFNLKVVNANGERLSFMQVVMRHGARMVSAALILFPFVHLLFGTKLQLFHDFLCGSKVIDTTRDSSESEAGASVDQTIQCAGLLRRVPAALVDCVAVASIETLVVVLVVFAGAYLLPSPNTATQGWIMMGATQAFGALLSLACAMFVMAMFESGPWQASPGKALMDLKVTNLDLSPISLQDALLKQLVQAFVYVSLLPIALLVSGAGFLLHGLGQVSWLNPVFIPLVGWGLFYSLYGAFACLTVYQNRQTVIDRFSSRYVLLESGGESGPSSSSSLSLHGPASTRAKIGSDAERSK